MFLVNVKMGFLRFNVFDINACNETCTSGKHENTVKQVPKPLN